MRKICVLSTDNNPDYFFYLPIVSYYWNKFGWDVVVFATEDSRIWNYISGHNHVFQIPSIENVRSNTLAQTVRHFVADVLPRDAYWQVQDIDLIPLKDHWHPDMNARTILGWETTGKTFIPVHYTGMTGDKWYQLMDCTGDLKADMEREMKANGRAYKKTWEEYWDTDWDILTQKVKKFGHQNFNFVHRGMAHCGRHTIPRGRVDRSSIVVATDGSYSWGETLHQPELLDAHCENHNPSSPEKWKMIRALLVQCYGEVPDWMDEYVTNHHAKYGR